MIYYGCGSCDAMFGVEENDKDLHLLSLRMECPSCLEDKIQIIRHPTRQFIAQVMSAKLLWQACKGLGLPDARSCSPDSVELLLRSATILAIEVEESPDPDRSLLSTITIDPLEGTPKKVYFGTSTRGATIYKVTEDDGAAETG